MRVVLDVYRIEGGTEHTADVYADGVLVSRLMRLTRDEALRDGLLEINSLHPGAEIELSGDLPQR